MSTIQRYVAEAAQAESLRRGPETFAERHVFVDLTELLTYLADREASLAAFRGDLRPLTAGLDCFLQGVLALGPASVTLAQDGNPSQAVALHCLPLQMAQAAAATRFQRTGNVKFAQEAFRLSPRQRLQVHEHLVASFPAVRSLIAPVLARHYVRGYDIAVSQAQWALLSAADVVPSFHALGMLLSGELATLEVYDAQFLEHVLGQDRDRLALLLGDEYFPGFSYKRKNVIYQISIVQTLCLIQQYDMVNLIDFLYKDEYFLVCYKDNYTQTKYILNQFQSLNCILQRQFLRFFDIIYCIISDSSFHKNPITQQDYKFALQHFSNKYIFSNLQPCDQTIQSTFIIEYHCLIKKLLLFKNIQINEFIYKQYKQFKSKDLCLNYHEFKYFYQHSFKVDTFYTIIEQLYEVNLESDRYEVLNQLEV
uniref:Uncharacterized protein n=1 Tax=Spironucleus salmonicida TaxID=348837 RepID=V6LYT2_9EUKA|eukprot:EST49428.1 Hypothetical protein SS50377_10258 [Spironucleus salmonicida]